MSFKKAFSAAVTAILTAVLISVCGFAAENDASEVKPNFSPDLSLVTRGYNEETMMHIYTFPDGAEFYASEILSDSENSTSILLVGSESEDVSIIVNGEDGFLEQSNEYFLSTDGSYEVTISHKLRSGSGSVQARFGVTIGAQSTAPEEKMITGRVSLENIDGVNFKHRFIDNSEFVTNVLDGETVSYIPKLIIPEKALCTATRNGNIFSMPSSGLITEDGSYKIEISCVDDDGKTERRYFSFTLFTKPTNRLGIYQPPYGYELSAVTLNGEEMPISDKSYIVLDGEGEYYIEYKNGTTTKSVSLTRDTVPPVIYLNGTTNVVFTESVFVSSDTDCTFRVTKNGQTLGEITELSGAGIYRVTATDTAGNIASVRVEIKALSAINPIDIIIIVAALAAAAAAYFIVQKNRKITVR